MDDLISRQSAIDAVFSLCEDCDSGYCGSCRVNYPGEKDVIKVIRNLPSAQPDIIQCRNCKFASGDSRICMKFDHSPIGELDFCSFAERREVTT